MARMDTVICHYRIKKGNEAAFEALLAEHWPTLDRLGLVAGEASRIYRGEEPEGPIYYEIFTWKDGETGSRAAHQSPEIMAIWGPMGELADQRPGRKAMDFPHVRPLAL